MKTIEVPMSYLFSNKDEYAYNCRIADGETVFTLADEATKDAKYAGDNNGVLELTVGKAKNIESSKLKIHQEGFLKDTRAFVRYTTVDKEAAAYSEIVIEDPCKTQNIAVKDDKPIIFWLDGDKMPE